MPEQISVSEFVAVTSEDLSSPAASSFSSKMQKCRAAVVALEEGALRIPDAKTIYCEKVKEHHRLLVTGCISPR
uniref:Uncharacterized protein n=1 Tax=Sphaerodactylus townsendi TaxID=933632 RepID=A0ACB8FR57_9SAUR